MGYPNCQVSVIDEQANLKAWEILLHDLQSLLNLQGPKLMKEFLDMVVEPFISSSLQPKTDVRLEAFESDNPEVWKNARETLHALNEGTEERNLVVIKHREVHRP